MVFSCFERRKLLFHAYHEKLANLAATVGLRDGVIKINKSMDEKGIVDILVRLVESKAQNAFPVSQVLDNSGKPIFVFDRHVGLSRY